MNKRGFIFVETIVTLTVLLVLLTTLYTSFTNLLNQEKINSEFEKKGDRYALFYMKETILDREYIEKYKNKYVKIPSSYGLFSGASGGADGYTWDANMAIIACNDDEEITVARDSYASYDSETPVLFVTAEFKRYVIQLKNMRNHCKEGAEYIIAGEFDNYSNRISNATWSNVYDNHSYAYVYYPNIKAADEE